MTIILVIIATGVSIIGVGVSIIIYHKQKPRPKLKIVYENISEPFPEEYITSCFSVKNSGSNVAEDVEYKITPKTPGILIKKLSDYPFDIPVYDIRVIRADICLKINEKCEIKVEVWYNNNTNRLKKRNSLEQKYVCIRTALDKVDFKKI